MNQFLFTLDDDPTIHAGPLPAPVATYCDADQQAHVWHDSPGPTVTCPDCRAVLYHQWMTELEQMDEQKQIIYHDDRGAAILKNISLKNDGYFVLFWAVRTGKEGDRCFYRTERLVNLLIDTAAHVVIPNQ